MTPAVTAMAATTTLLLLAATSWARWPATRSHSLRAARSRPDAEYVGATGDWSPLATIGATPAGHELDPPPSLAATHAELAGIGDALTAFSRAIDNALWEFIAPLDPEAAIKLLRAREWADHPDTGELDLAGLQALLAEGREVARR